jgi:hypothetical protein
MSESYWTSKDSGLFHIGNAKIRNFDDADHHRVNLFTPLIGVWSLDIAGRRPARIVDENIDGTKLVVGRCIQSTRRIDSKKIHDRMLGRSGPGFIQFRRRGSKLVGRPPTDQDVRALFAKRRRHPKAQPLARGQHERIPTFDPKIHFKSPPCCSRKQINYMA